LFKYFLWIVTVRLKREMKKEIIYEGRKIEYNLQYKNVKNINLRVKSGGIVNVSASKRVSQDTIDNFVKSNAKRILKAIEAFCQTENKEKHKYFDEAELKEHIISICEKVYPYFERKGIKYPKIRFKKMVSQWGNCYPKKEILTFNINLMYAPLECVEYVVLHEFTHFLQANHSKKFYEELEKVCPDWKDCRKKLRNIPIDRKNREEMKEL